MLRTEIEGKERFRTQAEGIAASAGRYESAARSARFSADKARAEMAVLEGALTGSKVGQQVPLKCCVRMPGPCSFSKCTAGFFRVAACL